MCCLLRVIAHPTDGFWRSVRFSVTSTNINLPWSHPGSNQDIRREKPAPNLRSCGMAHSFVQVVLKKCIVNFRFSALECTCAPTWPRPVSSWQFPLPGHVQSPAGSFAFTSTLPYVKLKDSTVRIRAEVTGFKRFEALPVLSQPQSCGFVHLHEEGKPGFIGHLYTLLGTTNNYSAIADFHTLQITTRCIHQPFPGNGFQQCRFFSFTRPGSIFTASHTELKWQLNYSAISSQPSSQNSALN
jgi:hypothetical protein